MNIQIETRLLKAAIQCAAKNDFRYYLNGILLEITNNRVVAVSTDGTILFTGYSDIPECGHEVTIIVPYETVTAALRGYKGETINLTRVESDQWILQNAAFQPIKGRFPKWRQVIPKELSGKAGSFDPLLLNRVHKALAAWDEVGPIKFNNFQWRQNGEKAALCHGTEPHAFCVIMSKRDEFSMIYTGWL